MLNSKSACLLVYLICFSASFTTCSTGSVASSVRIAVTTFAVGAGEKPSMVSAATASSRTSTGIVLSVAVPAATSCALIYVGILMLQGLKNVDFTDMDQMVPVSLMLLGMPVSGSIGHAIGIGLPAYTIMKVFSGKGKDVSVLTYVISVIFLIKFFVPV